MSALLVQWVGYWSFSFFLDQSPRLRSGLAPWTAQAVRGGAGSLQSTTPQTHPHAQPSPVGLAAFMRMGPPRVPGSRPAASQWGQRGWLVPEEGPGSERPSQCPACPAKAAAGLAPRTLSSLHGLDWSVCRFASRYVGGGFFSRSPFASLVRDFVSAQTTGHRAPSYSKHVTPPARPLSGVDKVTYAYG